MSTLEDLMQTARQSAHREQVAREYAAQRRDQERQDAIVDQLDENLRRALGDDLYRALGGSITLNSTKNAAALIVLVRKQRISLSYGETSQHGRHWMLGHVVKESVLVCETDYSSDLTFHERLLVELDRLTHQDEES